MNSQSKLSEFGFAQSEAKRNRYPIQATCMSCGKVKWLNWAVKGVHVCDECKEYVLRRKDG